MRWKIISTLLLVTTLTANAQGLFDAVRYSGTDFLGTARYAALAGSMGAIGGDPTSIIDNPAALGIYRSHEISLSLAPSIYTTLDNNNGSPKEKTFVNFSQGSVVFAFSAGREQGYVHSNFSFTYNRLKDFHRQVSLIGNDRESMASILAGFTEGLHANDLSYDNVHAPYLSVLGYNGYLFDPVGDSTSYAPRYNRAISGYIGEERGSIDEYTLSYAANISHCFYFGMSLGFQTLDYRLTSYNAEIYNDGAASELVNEFRSKGIGCLFRLGFIARPASFLRLGASLQTPVAYHIEDSFAAQLTTQDVEPGSKIDAMSDYDGYSSYGFRAPLKFQASVGFVLGKAGFLNFDYQLTNNKGMRFKGQSSSNSIFEPTEFAFENDEIRTQTLTSHLFRIGAEFRIAQTFSLRAGFAYRSPSMEASSTRSWMDNTTRTDLEYTVDQGSLYGSCGFGFRYNGFGIDVAYGYKQDNQLFAPTPTGLTHNGNGYFVSSDTSGRTQLRSIHHNVSLTLLYKF